MRCPKCMTLTLVPAGLAGDAARLVRCPRCPAAWVARPGEAPPAGGLPPLVRRGPIVIDGEIAGPRPPRRRFRFGLALAAGSR